MKTEKKKRIGKEAENRWLESAFPLFKIYKNEKMTKTCVLQRIRILK